MDSAGLDLRCVFRHPALIVLSHPVHLTLPFWAHGFHSFAFSIIILTQRRSLPMSKKASQKTLFQKVMVDPSMALVVPAVLSISYFVFGACVTTVCCVAGVQDCLMCSGFVTNQFSQGDDLPPTELDPQLASDLVTSHEQNPLSDEEMCY